MARPNRLPSVRGLVAALLLAAAFSAPTSAAAGPWVPEPGHGYVKLWLKYLYGFAYASGDGTTFNYGQYHEAFLSTYTEVGLFEQVGLVLHAPIARTFHLEDPRDGSIQSHFSPGDPTLSLRWQFLTEDRFVMGAEAGLRFPFARAGPVQEFYGADEGNPRIGDLQIGTGVWDVPLTLSAGYGWDEWYLAGSGGYVFRSDGYRHVITWSLEGGATVERDFGFRARVTGYHSIDVWFDAEAPGHDSPSGIGNGTTYIGFAVEVDWQVERGWFLGLSAEGALGLIQRQTGGPVITAYMARRF